MADEAENDPFIIELNNQISGLQDEIAAANKSLKPIVASENVKSLNNQTAQLGYLKTDFESAGKAASDIASDPENLTSENYSLIYSLAKQYSFWKRQSSLDEAVTNWFDSLVSKQQKEIGQFLFGEEKQWKISEVYKDLFKKGEEDWPQISEKFYQEAAWEGA